MEHWTHDPQYPHVFQLMQMSTHAGEILKWCRQQFGAADKVMIFDDARQCLAMKRTSADNGWYPWGNTSVHFRSSADAMLFKLTHS